MPTHSTKQKKAGQANRTIRIQCRVEETPVPVVIVDEHQNFLLYATFDVKTTTGERREAWLPADRYNKGRALFQAGQLIWLKAITDGLSPILAVIDAAFEPNELP